VRAIAVKAHSSDQGRRNQQGAALAVIRCTFAWRANDFVLTIKIGARLFTPKEGKALVQLMDLSFHAICCSIPNQRVAKN